jgi:hypothetical protein
MEISYCNQKRIHRASTPRDMRHIENLMLVDKLDRKRPLSDRIEDTPNPVQSQVWKPFLNNAHIDGHFVQVRWPVFVLHSWNLLYTKAK